MYLTKACAAESDALPAPAVLGATAIWRAWQLLR
jgi:hypothetical protein